MDFNYARTGIAATELPVTRYVILPWGSCNRTTRPLRSNSWQSWKGNVVATPA